MKILIVEDEFIVAEDIRTNLIKLGYEAHRAQTGEEAIAAVGKNAPDLVLLDIRLGEGLDGVSTAGIIRKMVDIPLIYITAHSDPATFERAKKTAPHAYIVKPFDFRNLHTAIELALFNFSRNAFGHPDDLAASTGKGEGKPEHYIFNDAVFIKFGNAFQKVQLKDIGYIQAKGSYSVLHTPVKEFTLAQNLHTVLERLNRSELLRVHRSYVVNLTNIDRIEEGGVRIKEEFIPVNKKIREELLKRFDSL